MATARFSLCCHVPGGRQHRSPPTQPEPQPPREQPSVVGSVEPCTSQSATDDEKPLPRRVSEDTTTDSGCASFKVFKKTSPNGKVTVYLGRRDVVDHVTHTDSIDGIVVFDPIFVDDRKLFGQIVANFRYGREEDEVMGLTFCKELYLAFAQIHPSSSETEMNLTLLQERLIKKHGPSAYPFFFELPPNAPPSVTLQPAVGDLGKPCGVDYELLVYVAAQADEKPNKRCTVRLGFRKVQYAPTEIPAEKPRATICKDFMLSPGKLTLQVSLGKQFYQHYEPIDVDVLIRNFSNKSVKKIKVCVVQITDICMFASGQYKTSLVTLESWDNCPITTGVTYHHVFHLTPRLDDNKDRRGVAMDGSPRMDPPILASSTIFPDPKQRDIFGFVISYVVKVKLYLGTLNGDMVAEVPFILMNPFPETEKKDHTIGEMNKYNGCIHNDSDEQIAEDIIQVKVDD